MTYIYFRNGAYNSIIEQLQELFKNNKDGHDLDHTLRVCKNAKLIANAEQCDENIVLLAALLHDVDDHKLFNTTNNANARYLMASISLDADTIEKVCQAINEVSFSHNKGKKPSTIEAAIVQDADRLDAIGAIGIARAFAYGGCHERTLDDTVQHFADKLLTLKDSMNTKTAKVIAKHKHKVMVEFLADLDNEKGWCFIGA